VALTKPVLCTLGTGDCAGNDLALLASVSDNPQSKPCMGWAGLGWECPRFSGTQRRPDAPRGDQQKLDYFWAHLGMSGTVRKLCMGWPDWI
jgi:hypothetical protein